MNLNEKYWTDRYSSDQIGWDIGYAGPLAHILDGIEDKSLRILIPGAGNGYEAEYAHKLGFSNITVLDISKAPLNNLKKRCPALEKSLIHEDFFTHQGEYDFILEQTFFCALSPSLREKYVQKTADLLSPKGILTGVLFNFPLDSGPPFGGTRDEYNSLFSLKFIIQKIEECSFSIQPRKGKELYFQFEKK